MWGTTGIPPPEFADFGLYSKEIRPQTHRRTEFRLKTISTFSHKFSGTLFNTLAWPVGRDLRLHFWNSLGPSYLYKAYNISNSLCRWIMTSVIANKRDVVAKDNVVWIAWTFFNFWSNDLWNGWSYAVTLTLFMRLARIVKVVYIFNPQWPWSDLGSWPHFCNPLLSLKRIDIGSSNFTYG